jgi:hypothetical protein
MMVIYTTNIIYGFSTKSHTPRRGGYTPTLRIKQYYAKPSEGKGGIHSNSTHSAYHAKPTEGKTPPLADIDVQPICPTHRLVQPICPTHRLVQPICPTHRLVQPICLYVKTHSLVQPICPPNPFNPLQPKNP